MNWQTIKNYGQRAGREVCALAEACYRTLKDPRLAYRHKTLILTALIYFLSPIDAIPDFLPGGFVDDISVLLGALLATGQVGQKHLQQCRIKYGIIPEPENEEKRESIEPPQAQPTE